MWPNMWWTELYVVFSFKSHHVTRPIDCYLTNGCPSPHWGMWAPHHHPLPSLSPMTSTNPMAAMTPTHSATSREGKQGGEQRGVGARRTTRAREESRTQRGHVKPTRRLVVSPPSCSIDNEMAWKPHAASFILPVASKTRQCGVHMPPHFHTFLWCWRRGSVESTCCPVSPLSWGIKDEAAWVHMLPRFPSFLGHRRRGSVESTCHLVSPLSWGIEDEAAWIHMLPVTTSKILS